MNDLLEQDREIQVMLDELNQNYGYDFRDYSIASMRRRIRSVMDKMGSDSIKKFTERLKSDSAFAHSVIASLTVNVTEMFRDPEVYRAIRQDVIPWLRTFPSIRIWHAGCATGEELYSMAILLFEEGLYDRSFLYGTDISLPVIEKAKKGVYSGAQIQAYTANYHKSGGRQEFSDYYTAEHDFVKIQSFLQKNVFFTQHSLVTDEVFAEVQMIFCRNVLIYFSKNLQNRAFSLFHRSLARLGYLCLGVKETIEFSNYDSLFEVVGKQERIYKKV